MAKKKKITSKDIMTYYMNYILIHGQQPKTVYAFTKANDFDEQLFYQHFGSFKNLEQHIFKAFIDHTISALEKSEDYSKYSARHKLLSFYFTFFENLTANRSYVIHALSQHKNNLKSLEVLSELKHAFTSYIEHLDIELLDMKQEHIDRMQRRGLKESAWLQLLMTLKFWMEDSSKNFEKTDVFIEKSINTSFDILNIAPIKSLMDFGKFLFKEKVKMN